MEGSEYKPFGWYSRSVLRVNASHTSNYTCYAINQMVEGRQSYDQKSFMVYVEHPEEEDESGSSQMRKDYSMGYCAPYNGKVCRKFLQGRGLVWFNVSSDDSGGWLNEQIAENLWHEVVAKLDEPCKSAAEALLCKYAFPDCVLRDGVSVGLPICRQDCVALRNHFCFNAWAMIQENKRNGIFVDSRGHFRLPKCERLPKFRGEGKKKTCTRSDVTAMKYDQTTKECVKERGRFYQGSMNATVTGLRCQTWFSNSPHGETLQPGIFPEMKNAGNSCRNPGGTEPKPWCYTVDPNVRWQFCNITPCEVSAVKKNDDAFGELILNFDDIFGPDFIRKAQDPIFLVLAGSILLALIIIIVLFCMVCSKLWKCCCCCCGGEKSKDGYAAAPQSKDDASIDLEKLPQNANYHNTSAQLHPSLENLEYPRNDIIYIRDIGQGAFGRVFQAKAPGLVNGEDFTMVAVKMLKEEATDDLQKDFEKEATLLAEFDHPNIVRLLGVCAVGKPMCLLFEYMAKGDLSAYLRSSNPTHFPPNGSNASSSLTGTLTEMTHVEQVNISKQICAGMVYLSDRKFVHRDLASRNCLMDNYGNVKIADFGLSQKIYLQDYYRGDEQDAIPIRWMPLESILQNKYTVESDVWAFGVLLWEIFSLGLQPYFGQSHEEVVAYLKAGNVLTCPDNTPKSAYRVMLGCWQRKSSDRPSFRNLYRELETIEKELALIRRHFKSQKSILSSNNIVGSSSVLDSRETPPPNSPNKSLA